MTARYWTCTTRHLLRTACCRPRVTGNLLLAVCYWPPRTGRLRLAAYYWYSPPPTGRLQLGATACHWPHLGPNADLWPPPLLVDCDCQHAAGPPATGLAAEY